MSGNVQFGRFVEVEIRDFESRTKTVIGNEFEINFEYYKSVDQTLEDDSGTIRIYGLSDERIKSLQFEGGEVRLRCGYLGSEIETLIIASITRLYSVKDSNTSLTTIDCSANLMNHYITDRFSNTGGNQSVLSLVSNMAKSIGYDKVEVDLSTFSVEDATKIEQYLSTAKTRLSIAGSISDAIKVISDQVGLSWRQVDGVKIVVTPTKVGANKILGVVKNGYAKVSSGGEGSVNDITFLKTLEANTQDNTITILNYQTGLISSNKEYRISYAYSDQIVGEDEEIVTPSGVDVKKPSLAGSASQDNPFVSNSNLSGIKIKNSASTSNGMVRKNTAEFAKIVSSHFGYDIIRHFSSFNDDYHKNKGGKHPIGLAFDFSLNNSNLKHAAKITQEVRQLAKDYGFKVALLDEYNYPSENSTGGHIHVSVLGIDNETNYLPQYNKSGAEPLRRRTSVTSNLEYRNVKALLNPSIKPQSQLAILEEVTTDKDEFESKGREALSSRSEDIEEERYKVCRVRNAKFTGNNKSGEWIMQLFCEDTDSMLADEKEVARILATNPESSVNIVEAVDKKKPKKPKKDKDVLDDF